MTATVSLKPITADNVRAICRLAVRQDQEGFVAPNAISLAEAHFYPRAWFRAIYAGEEPVGFVMLEDDPVHPWLWRFMIDARHQGEGYGRSAMDLIIARARARPEAEDLRLSYVPGEGCPGPFYARLGFEETGEIDEGERVMRLVLRAAC